MDLKNSSNSRFAQPDSPPQHRTLKATPSEKGWGSATLLETGLAMLARASGTEPRTSQEGSAAPPSPPGRVAGLAPLISAAIVSPRGTLPAALLGLPPALGAPPHLALR